MRSSTIGGDEELHYLPVKEAEVRCASGATPPGAWGPWNLGLIAVVLLIVGTGWYQILTVPPFYLIDEQAHVGYVLELHAGRLPTIDTPIDETEGGLVLRQRLDFTRSRYGEVWVANNPPVAYLAAAPAAALTRAVGLPGGALLGVRFTNLVFFAAAAVYVAFLGRRLGGDDALTGLLAAALFATVPHVGATAGAGFIDGLALLCTVALLHSLVSITQSGATPRQVLTLSIWCAIGAGVRPMTAAVAAASAALALTIILVRAVRHAAADDEVPLRRTMLRSTAVIVLPTLVLNGWYYLRNVELYGDPTASARLFEKFGRTSRPGSLNDVWRPDVWDNPARVLLNRRLPLDEPSSLPWLWEATHWAVVAIALAATTIVILDRVHARGRRSAPRTPTMGWALSLSLLLVVVLMTAQHWLGGGNIHARYLLFGVVVLAVGAALVLRRLGATAAGLVLVLALMALQAHEVPLQNKTIRAQAWTATAPSALVEPIAPAGVRFLGIVLMAAGTAALVVALLALSRAARSSGTTRPA